MNKSNAILKACKDIVSKTDQSFYVIANDAKNLKKNYFVYSSPSIQQIIGVNQYELAQNPSIFTNAVHPDFLDYYLQSNQQLLSKPAKEKRNYLIKNKVTSNYIPIEEIAISSYNNQKNCIEIYCILKKLPIEFYSQNINTNKYLINNIQDLKSIKDIKKELTTLSSNFLNALCLNTNIIGCRIYAYNQEIQQLNILADNQKGISNDEIENKLNIKIKTTYPTYSNENYFFKILSNNISYITSKKSEIIAISKAHTTNLLLHKFASWAVKIYKLKTFGILPITLPNNKMIGIITFASNKVFNQEEKKWMEEYVSITSLLLTSLLEEYTIHTEQKKKSLQ